MARVLIADDHAVVRAGYKIYLESLPDITECGEASSADDVLAQLTDGSWDLLLLDNHMPARSGLQTLAQIRAKHPDVRVLIVSGLPEEQYARHFLCAGASGYLSKSAAPGEFFAAVRKVLSRQRYVSQTTAELMLQDLDKPKVPRHRLLSQRELQVFKRLAVGTTITKIGCELGISVKTVSTYRFRLLEKMSLKSNADIVAYVARYRIPLDRADELLGGEDRSLSDVSGEVD